jgi:hypothetical protein
VAGNGRWPAMSQVILLSLTASLNPTLVAATTVMLLLDKPARLMLGYLLGAYITSITLGLIIVFSLSGSSASNTTENTISPAVGHWLGRDRAGHLVRSLHRARRASASAPASSEGVKARQGAAALAARTKQRLTPDNIRDRRATHASRRVVPGRSRSDPQAEVLDDHNGADRDRL